MASTRLRKTFHYPGEDSDEDTTPQAIDEEEQEKLIAALRAENDGRNQEYKRFFLAIPIIGATSYLPTLLMSRPMSAKLMSLISMASLIMTAYILISEPSVDTDAVKSKRSMPGFLRPTEAVYKSVTYCSGLSGLLIAFIAFNLRAMEGVHDGFWLLYFLPALCFTVIKLARYLMLSIDLDELERLKYGYKGA